MDCPINSQRTKISKKPVKEDAGLLSTSSMTFSQGLPRLKKMDPVAVGNEPAIIERNVERGNSREVTVFRVVTEKSKVLAHAFVQMLRMIKETPVQLFALGLFVRETREIRMSMSVWKRLYQAEILVLHDEKNGTSTISVPVEVKSPGFKICCDGGLLDSRSDFEDKFLKIKSTFKLICEYQNNLLLAFNNGLFKTAKFGTNDSGGLCLTDFTDSESEYIKQEKQKVGLFLDIFLKRSGFLIGCLEKITPTALNSYLLYEMVLTEFFMLSRLVESRKLQSGIFFPQVFEAFITELIYISRIIEILRPYAVEAYEALGYAEKDFEESQAEINEILSSFNLSVVACHEREVVESISKEPIQESHPPKEAIPKESQRTEDRTSSQKLRIEKSNGEPIDFEEQQALKQRLWEENKKQREQERIERKAAKAKEVVSCFKESVKAAEEKKLTQRLASTEVFYELPSRQQFETIYSELSTDHRCTFDALFTAEDFSITADKIHQLAAALKKMMIAIGIDQATAIAFEIEVLNRNHSAHKSSDTGKELPKGYIQKRCTSFIIFALYPIGWKPKSFDEYKAMQVCQQRMIDKQLAQC